MGGNIDHDIIKKAKQVNKGLSSQINVDEKRQRFVKEFYQLQIVKIQSSFLTHTD